MELYRVRGGEDQSRAEACRRSGSGQSDRKENLRLVKKRFDSENGGAGELSLQINKVSNDGTIDLEASEQCRFGDCRGETIFKVNERLRLTDDPKGPRLEILKKHRLPNEQ